MQAVVWRLMTHTPQEEDMLMLARRLVQRRGRPLRLAALTIVLGAGISIAAGAAGASAAAVPPGTPVDQVLQASNPTPAVGTPVAFSIVTSSTSGPISSNATWNFGDGPSQIIYGGSAVHAFNSPGVYNISVTGTSQSGQPVTATTSVRVVGSPNLTASTTPGTTSELPGTVAVSTVPALPPASVAIVSPPTSGAVDQPLVFTATAISPNACGTIAGYLWDFGDGTPPLTGSTVAHAYTTPGTYNVNLTVTDCSGSTGAASTQVRITAALPPGVPVSYAGGWNLIAGAPGSAIVGAGGPLYTLQAGDSSYETIGAGTPLVGGEGYWAYFPSGGAGSIPFSSTATMTVPLPAGAFVMVGNSASTAATVTGADEVLIYTPSSGYAPATVLQPGQGAWVFSYNGGVATITPQP